MDAAMGAKVKAWIKGCLRSWTQWFSVLLMAWPLIEGQASVLVAPFLPDGAEKWVIAALGVTSFLLRAKTTESLAAKGAK